MMIYGRAGTLGQWGGGEHISFHKAIQKCGKNFRRIQSEVSFYIKMKILQ